MNAEYQVSYRAVRKAVEILKGWNFSIIRTGKTGGIFDLVGIRASDMIGIRVKSCPINKVPSLEEEKKELKNIEAPANFRKELWIYERRRGFHFISI